jgi:hypothetical protein
MHEGSQAVRASKAAPEKTGNEGEHMLLMLSQKQRSIYMVLGTFLV